MSGDPGMGKTTLLNRLAQDLTFAPSSGPLIDRFGWVLPVPMVLRELPLGTVTTFDGLLEAFLSQPVGEPLRDGDYLHSLLAQGRALLMLDGLDELGSSEELLEFRFNLRSAVFDGMRQFPDCLWLLTSRTVGYSDVRYEGQPDPRGRNESPGPGPTSPAIGRRYVAPFDDRRVRRFIHNWYRLRDTGAVKAGKPADLGDAIRRDKSLQRLARIPNVLALMALVHRSEATLPHERSALYQRIAEAHLESTDKHRGVSESTLDLPRKRMWLARVGYEMQCLRRSYGVEDDPVASDDGKLYFIRREIAASREDVLSWVASEIERSKASVNVPTLEEFLSFIGRRGGLLVPRDNDHYAFSHLSFQEYFTAVALEEEVTGFQWAKEGSSSLGFSRPDLARRAQQRPWLETFCFLFEMVADRPEWHGALMDCIFGEGFSIFGRPHGEEDHRLPLVGDSLFNLGHLAARLVVNPYSGLDRREREQAIHECVFAQIRSSKFGNGDVSLLTMLMSAGREREVMESIRGQWPSVVHDLPWKVLDFRGADAVDEAALKEFSGLNVLNLSRTPICDTKCIARLKSLRELDLSHTLVEDISPIGRLVTLKELNLEGTRVKDIVPLAGLRNLEALWLADTRIKKEQAEAIKQHLPDCFVAGGGWVL